MPETDLRRSQAGSRHLMENKKEYADRRRRQTVSLIPIGGVAAATAMGGGGALGLSDQAFLTVVGVVILGFFVFSLVNWRCPSCGAYLGQRLNPRECNACGATLRD